MRNTFSMAIGILLTSLLFSCGHNKTIDELNSQISELEANAEVTNEAALLKNFPSKSNITITLKGTASDGATIDRSILFNRTTYLDAPQYGYVNDYPSFANHYADPDGYYLFPEEYDEYVKNVPYPSYVGSFYVRVEDGDVTDMDSDIEVYFIQDKKNYYFSINDLEVDEVKLSDNDMGGKDIVGTASSVITTDGSDIKVSVSFDYSTDDRTRVDIEVEDED